MRLALTTRYLSATGGMELQMLQMGKELARRGNRIDVLFNRDGDLHAEFSSFSHSVSKVPSFTFARARAVRDLVRLSPALAATVRARPDVVYVNNPDELAFGLLAGRITRAPVICHLHGTTFTKEELMASMVPKLCARAYRLVACSEFVRNQFVEAGIAPSKVSTVHNGVELDDYLPATAAQRVAAREQLGLPADGFVTLYLGRLEVEKGVEVLLEAWGRSKLSPDRARLLIVGSAAAHANPEGRLQELQSLAPPGCHWLPARRDVLTPLHAADVLVVPSMWNEAFGRVVVEGLAAGLPVVASRAGGIPEILDGELAPFLFERGSAEELADRLESLIDWRKERPELGEQCTAHVAQRFSIERMVDGVEKILQEAVS